MTKLYFNLFHKTAILINEDNKTYQIIKGDLSHVKSLFKYPATIVRLGEIYRNVKSNYQVA